jgi:uncharacterized protein (DUF1684 family)
MSVHRLWTRGIGVVSVAGLALVGAVACQQASAKDGVPTRTKQPAATPAQGQAQAAKTYDAVDTQTWRDKREADLKAPDGWLSVSGLHFLEPGISTIGTAPSDNVSLPAGSIPAKAGRVRVEGGRVFLTLAKGIAAKINGEPIRGSGEIELRDATAPNVPEKDKRPADRVTLGRVAIHVHHSGDRLALRVRDPESPIRRDFVGLRWYDIDPAWQVEGKFIPFDQPKQLQIPNVLGDQEAVESPGEVEVTINGQTARLLALSAAKGRLWFVFTDSTADIRETYRIRFLYADAPVNGRVTLDFNRAYNPPCAYNPYTTCPLPPSQNKLRTPVAAGERAYAGPHPEPTPTASE